MVNDLVTVLVIVYINTLESGYVIHEDLRASPCMGLKSGYAYTLVFEVLKFKVKSYKRCEHAFSD